MASNYQDVLDQLRAFGLIVESLRVGEARPVRTSVEGDREKRGWYILHELHTRDGDTLIVGSYGQWRGNENHAQKIEIRKTDAFTAEQRKAITAKIREDRKRADAVLKREQARAAARAAVMWSRLAPTGESEYLDRKGVQPHGLRFTPNGSAVLPLLDAAGRLHGLQLLRSPALAKAAGRPAKEFWPKGLAKKGHFHLLGAPAHLVLVAEGYATAATLHEATGYPVAVAFDAGNLAPVATALRWRYKRTRILICADDDAFTEGNPGVTAASTAALGVDGAILVPRFADEAGRHEKHTANGHKLTDFNDLHQLEGLHVVRTQVETRLTELQWHAPAAPLSTTTRGAGDGRLKPVESVDELLRRYALVYAHSGAVFDRQEHILMSLSDMRDVCIRKDLHRAWVESPRRDIVRIRDVGFDPTLSDPEITCNLFKGWPTTPAAGSCDRLLDLLRYMCSTDRNAEQLFQWVLKWIAYPIQHPGAKMKSTLVVHGPQGTGKNLFFESVMGIYGEYGDVLDQSALEDRFNDWASRKLFMLADEVVAAADKYHIKNQLKALITGDRIRINPKNIGAYWERNHLNLVFLSNEAMPMVLEEDDRRHCVLWTPAKQSKEYYAAVIAEIRSGGVAALHDHLLHLDLGDFGPGTVPPVTAAKDELIRLALDSPMRFYDDIMLGEIQGLQAMPGLVIDWYEAYKLWCNRVNTRAAPMPKFVNALERKRGTRSERKRYQVWVNDQVQESRGPHAVLMMGNVEPPADVSETTWLGQQVGKFRNLLADFRGRT